MELGYLGPEGSYSYIAAKHYLPKGNIIAMKTFRQIITAVEEGSIEAGILPIENSTEGAVTQVMDGLMNTVVSRIQGEMILQVRLNLLSIGENIKELRYVLSHPQPLEQCREFMVNHFPQVVLRPCGSTSEACKIAREKGKEYGAIANSWAAENNGLKILYRDIQDNVNNQTRFVIIGRKDTIPTGRDKTSIAFSFHDDFPGSLYNVLREFAEERINLTRVESRPAKTELGKYIFYVDFEGHKEAIKAKKVLSNIEKMTNKLKIFGSYPIGRVF
ncbi:prephenate dehydratase [Anaerovirgula multivorans]|uniref:Prephenate dehydratase n=1 Tax=Anaerovirgula multivorans TaxID=312168 RepID=A0A239HJ90_9FIRM|nr:prephenate dehydratase [Anaerovirgula multivorans]SNS81417.1 prephenate dehydratase [Anaerovirgula multivorans]